MGKRKKVGRRKGCKNRRRMQAKANSGGVVQGPPERTIYDEKGEEKGRESINLGRGGELTESHSGTVFLNEGGRREQGRRKKETHKKGEGKMRQERVEKKPG